MSKAKLLVRGRTGGRGWGDAELNPDLQLG